MTMISSIPNLSSTSIFIISLLLRIAFFLFGLYQDAYMPLPYTDIDYFVFTDAAKFVANGNSPYLRETYRYTPLLSWILLPTTYNSTLWFSFGKFIFIICDLITGLLLIISLPINYKILSTIWLLNPMVITISTRGSSESLLTCFILLSIFTLIKSSNNSKFGTFIAGLLLGISIHLKIYPFIYIPTSLLFIDSNQSFWQPITIKRLLYITGVIIGFSSLTYWMYIIYGMEYLNESYFYHLIRLDHRHNFSIYNVLLYLNSAISSSSSAAAAAATSNILKLEKLAFIPQLSLSLIIIPLTLSIGFNSKNETFRNLLLYKILFIQTFIFIIFNKVCTSQYFIWFLALLPPFLVNSKLINKKGIILLTGWIVTQALWLFNGWRLEFKGTPDIFTTGLFVSSALFFLWNVYIVSELINDVKLQISNELKLVDNKKD